MSFETSPSASQVTRRSFLIGMTASVATASLLAACGGAATVTTASAAVTTTSSPVAASAVASTTSAPTSASVALTVTSAATTVSASVAASAAAPATGPATVIFNNRIGVEADSFALMAQEFNKTTPDIKVKMESFPGASYFQKISVLVAGGTAGDLVWMASIQGLYGYASRGVWRWTDDYIARDKIDPSQWYPASFQMMKFQGKTIGLPLWAHPSVVGLFYNEDLFKAQGMTPPNGSETFTQLSDMATRLTKTSSNGKIDQYGYLPGTDWYNGLGQVMLAMGGQMLSSDGKTLTFDQAQPKAALQWLYDLFQKSKVAPNPTNTGTGTLAANGKLAMWASGMWGSWSASQWKFNWGATLTPVGPGSHGAMLQTDTSPITAKSKVPDAAWAFHKFMSSKPAGEILLQKNYVLSPRPDIWTNAANIKGLAPFAQVMPQAVELPVPANFHCNALDLTITPIATDLWLGKTSVDQAVQKLNQAGNTEIAQP